MMSPASIFVEWISDGAGKGSLRQITDGLEAVGILGDELDRDYLNVVHRSRRELSDCSILDFGEGGKWTVQPTRLAMVRQQAGLVTAVVCGARDSRVHLALSKTPPSIQSQSLGQFGLQVVGPVQEIVNWAEEHALPIELHWIAIQVKQALDQLGSINVKRASEPSEDLGTLISREGPFEIRRLSTHCMRESVVSLPHSVKGAMLEVVEQYTSRRIRYVGTEKGWLKVPYVWAPWICAASTRVRLTEIRAGRSMSVPLWARLPEGLARAVTLASGTPWADSNGSLVSGKIPPALAYNLKRILAVG